MTRGDIVGIRGNPASRNVVVSFSDTCEMCHESPVDVVVKVGGVEHGLCDPCAQKELVQQTIN